VDDSLHQVKEDSSEEQGLEEKEEALDPLAGFLKEDSSKRAGRTPKSVDDVHNKACAAKGGSIGEFAHDEDEEDSEENDDDETDDQDAEDEDEFESEPILLRLGAGGRIRTLDVRLVGRDIHVLIEDAFLTVEAVRVAPPSATEKSAEATADVSKTKATAAPPKKAADPKTVGDRVIANNWLARLVSMIPNLFLRDIHIRFVVRHDTVPAPSDVQSVDDSSLPPPTFEYSAEDAVIELGIELLSVTDGTDFLARFKRGDGDAESVDGGGGGGGGEDDGQYASQSAQQTDAGLCNNEYLVKRIRTGRGPEGGIHLRVFPPGELMPPSSIPESLSGWSKSQFAHTTHYSLLRCSGLDINARVFLGTAKEIAIVNNTWYDDYDYDGYSVDAMLFSGVDYIAPGPQPPLPPIQPLGGSNLDSDADKWVFHGASSYRLDDNGIQSSGVASNFHRLARGMLPQVCRREHFPCECCAHCWSAKPGVTKEHALDDALPMGGLVLHFSVRDPAEINICRDSLETLGMIISLFTKRKVVQDDLESLDSLSLDPSCQDSISVLELSDRSFVNNSSSSNNINNLSNHNNNSSSININRSRPSRADFRRTDSGQSFDSVPRRASRRSNSSNRRLLNDSGHNSSFVSDHSQTAGRSRAQLDHSKSGYDRPTPGKIKRIRKVSAQPAPTKAESKDAFPSYMQPESIQILGLHLADITVRVHILRESSDDDGLSFSYWDLAARCVTMDMQSLNTDIRRMQDVRLDVANLTLIERSGTARKCLASLGIRKRVVEFDEVTIETYMTKEGENDRPPWPSTASALLDLQPPLETLTYEDRERHAMQLRYISTTHKSENLDQIYSAANIRVGAAVVDTPYAIKDRIFETIKQARQCVLPQSDRPAPVSMNESSQLSLENEIESIMKYKLQIDGGKVRLDPLINVQLPLTALYGERSSAAGLSFESVLENINLSFGKREKTSALREQRISLSRLANLPDHVRLRILLFLPDLRPLELALQSKPQSNSFLRCREVNQQIVKLAKKSARQSIYASASGSRHNRGDNHRQDDSSSSDDDDGEEASVVNRRQEILSDLLKLDEDELEDLWMLHQRQKRKQKKKRNVNM
jgi:hypothetical protein